MVFTFKYFVILILFVLITGQADRVYAQDNSSGTREKFDVGKESDLSRNVDYGGSVDVRGSSLPDNDVQSEFTTHAKFYQYVEWQPRDNWDMKGSVNVHYYSERGSDDDTDTDIDYDENYTRYTQDDLKVTLGAQKVIWGRVDGPKPTDQLGSLNLKRPIEGDYEDQRQAMPGLRLEYFHDNYKLDGLVIIEGRPTKIADEKSIWSILNKQEGRILSVKSSDLMRVVLQNANIPDENDNMKGVGFRFNKNGEDLDWAVTAQRVERMAPFYQPNPGLIRDISAGTPVDVAISAHQNEGLLQSIHPWSTVLGGDVAVPVGSSVLRAEGAWITNVPVYTDQFMTDNKDAFYIVIGGEFYPGNEDLRVIAQLSAYVLSNDNHIIDRGQIYTLNGSLENQFNYGRWVVNLDYSFGLNAREIHLEPQLTYKGWDQHEVYVGMNYFSGSTQTIGGFFEDNLQFNIGWNYKF